MTEAEWLSCADPKAMLAVVPAEAVRKLRLFAIACCERIDQFITDPRSRAALDFAIRHVETPLNRQKGRKAIEKAGRDAWSDAYNAGFTHGANRPACMVRSCAADAAVQAMSASPKLGAGYASSFACFAVAWKAVSESKPPVAFNITDEHKAPEFAAQAHLVRDIFGNPFRKAKCKKSWLTSDVVALAKGIYDDRAFDRMPILADALQDAGCDSEEVLNHCRDANQVHVRGCWVVDLLLGKS